MKLTNKINSAGICTHCKKQEIEYGIIKGHYWYYCHACKKTLSNREVEIKR